MLQRGHIVEHFATVNPDRSAVLYVKDETGTLHHAYFENDGEAVAEAFAMNPEEFWLTMNSWFPFRPGEVD